jgi:hypothetical protein
VDDCYISLRCVLLSTLCVCKQVGLRILLFGTSVLTPPLLLTVLVDWWSGEVPIVISSIVHCDLVQYPRRDQFTHTLWTPDTHTHTHNIHTRMYPLTTHTHTHTHTFLYTHFYTHTTHTHTYLYTHTTYTHPTHTQHNIPRRHRYHANMGVCGGGTHPCGYRCGIQRH